MYQFTCEQLAVLNSALVRALTILRKSAHPVPVTDDAAKQFLSREILRLHRDGATEQDVLACNSVAILRNFVQAQESARRTVKPMRVSSRNEANAWRDPKRMAKEDRSKTVKTVALRLSRFKERVRSRGRLLNSS